jgi:hypothetical protein
MEMGLAQRDGQGVCGIAGLAVSRQLEQARHHQGHLPLLGAAVARDLQLDRGGGEGHDGQARLRAGQEDGAAHVAEDEGAPRIGRVEDVFHGQDVGAQARDDRRHSRVDEGQLLGELEARRGSEHSFLQEEMAPPVGLDGSVSGAQGAGIDAEDDHAAEAPRDG